MAALREIMFQKSPTRTRGKRAVFLKTNPTMVQNSTPLGMRMANPTVRRERRKIEILEARINWAEVALGTK